MSTDIVYFIIMRVEPATLDARARSTPLVALPSRTFQRSPLVVPWSQKFLKKAPSRIRELPDREGARVDTKKKNHTWHMLLSSDVAFILITGVELDICDGFLNDIKALFLQQFTAANIMAASELGLNAPFQNSVQQKMEYWGNPTTMKMITVQQQIVEVKEIVHDQIQNKLMARQEKLESLQQGSEDMSLLSGNFAKRSKARRCKICCGQLKCKILIFACCGFLILLLVGYIVNGFVGLGWKFDKNRK